MLLKDLTNIIEENYPIGLAYDWDNPGLILGDWTQNVDKVMVTLDVTEDVLNEAIECGCQCVISHHPLIFGGIKKIDTSSKNGRIILNAAQHNTALYAAHTNMDTAPGGINKKLSDMFHLKNSEIIEKNIAFAGAGLGCIGDIDKISLRNFAILVKRILHTPYVRLSGNPDQTINRVAVGSGSCSELIPAAIGMGADVIVTGDLKYHTCLDYAGEDFSIIDAGHFPTEHIVGEMFADILKNADVEVVCSSQRDIFKIV